MKLELRPRQVAARDAIAAAFRAGYKRVMVAAPCGFGKTELATAILHATFDNGKRGAFIADRISLINQTSARFDKYDLPHGVAQGDHWRWRPSEQIQICSIQTLQRRRWPETNLNVVDEAHVLTATMREKLEKKDCFSIGLSATPVTPGLGKYFDVVINAATTNELIEEGSLVPLRIFSCVEPDMEGVPVIAGEWSEKEASKRALQVVGDVVAEYLEKGEGRKFIGFGVDIAHVQELQRQFLAAGLNVATYTADDLTEDRDQIVEEFKKPDSSIQGILSVEALTRGFDVSDVSCLIYARPLRNAFHVHIQILGRVMRTADGKFDGLVLDHSGNCKRFWKQMQALFSEGVQELDTGKKKEKEKPKQEPEKEPVKCPQCGHMHNPAPFCAVCGHEYPKRASVEHVPGTLKELLAQGSPKNMSNVVWPMVCGHVRNGTTPPEKQRAKALAIYKSMTGTWPKGEFEFTEPQQPTPEVASKIRSLNIRFAKSRSKQSAAVAA